MKVRTRFAPSPTGYLHIGGVRTALFSWLYAKKQGGQFVLRIEDTDPERSTEEAIGIILEGMHWLGLDYDEGPFYQSKRFPRYQEVVQQLLDAGHAYHCYCSKETLQEMRETAMARGDKPRYDGRCRNLQSIPAGIDPVVRFKNPTEGEVTVDDLIQGSVTFQNRELDDLVLTRSDGIPTYNLTVVVDDMDMEITHVIRGDDHLNNTPRQINIFNALGVKPPHHAHVPLILGEDGKRLSKRHGAASVLDYRKQGYLPEALLNYLVRLGWSHGDQEIFTLDEMQNLFDISAINKSAASINPEKLLWLNQHYLKNTPADKLTGIIKPYFEQAGIDVSNGPALKEVVAVQKERAKTLLEITEQSRTFYTDEVNLDEKAANKHLSSGILLPLSDIRAALESLEWDKEAIHQLIKDVADKHKLKIGKIAQPLRVAVTGVTVSPSIDVTIWLVGRERSLHRLDQALQFIKDHAPA